MGSECCCTCPYSAAIIILPIVHSKPPLTHTEQHNGSGSSDPFSACSRPHNQGCISQCRQGVCQQPRGQVIGICSGWAWLMNRPSTAFNWFAVQLLAGPPRPRSLCLLLSCQPTSPSSARRLVQSSSLQISTASRCSGISPLCRRSFELVAVDALIAVAAACNRTCP